MAISVKPNLSRVDLLQIRESLEIVAHLIRYPDTREFQEIDFSVSQLKDLDAAVQSYRLLRRRSVLNESGEVFIEHLPLKAKAKEKIQDLSDKIFSFLTTTEEAAHFIEEKLRLSFPIGLQREWGDYSRKNRSFFKGDFRSNPFERYAVPPVLADVYLYSACLLSELPQQRRRLNEATLSRGEDLSFWRDELNAFAGSFLRRKIQGNYLSAESLIHRWSSSTEPKSKIPSQKEKSLASQFTFPTGMRQRQLERNANRILSRANPTSSDLFQASSDAISVLADMTFDSSERAMVRFAAELMEHALLMSNVHSSNEVAESMEKIVALTESSKNAAECRLREELIKALPFIPRGPTGDATRMSNPHYPLGTEVKVAQLCEEILSGSKKLLDELFPSAPSTLRSALKVDPGMDRVSLRLKSLPARKVEGEAKQAELLI